MPDRPGDASSHRSPHYEPPEYEPTQYDSPQYEPAHVGSHAGRQASAQPVAAVRVEREPRPVDFVEVRDSAEFAGLRSKFRAFAFPMTLAFIVWYLSYVLLSTFAVELMSTPVIGNLNVGLLWGLAQFVTTFLLTWLYVRHANKHLDPITRDMRRAMAVQEGKL